MCKVQDCKSKKNYNESEFCYRHRGKIGSSNITEEEMSPNAKVDTPAPEEVVAIDEVVKEEEMPSMTETQSKLSEAVYPIQDSSNSKLNNKTSKHTDLFEQIFDLTTGGPCVENLKTTDDTFYEKFDHNKLAFILNNLEIIKEQYRPNARDSLSLDKYYEKSRNGNSGVGCLRVKYFQNCKDSIRGRLQAFESLSGQNMVREVRHTIFNDYYIDMDMDNCHPVLTVWMCNKLSIPCEFMAEYVKNREQHIKDVMSANQGLSRDDVKRLFLSINYGGKSIYDHIENKTDFLQSYKSESARIKQAICDTFKYFKTESDRARIKKGQRYNLEGAAMSHICCFVENQLLMIILEYLKTRVGDVSDSILCFDGIMIRKEKFNESYLRELEQIFSDMGIDMKLSIKPFAPLDLKQFGFDESKRYEYASKPLQTSNREICLDRFNDYQIDEVELERLLDEAGPKEKATVVCNEIKKLLKHLPDELIRTNDLITTYDIVSGDVFTLREIAKLIKQTVAYIYNDGDYYFCVKSTQVIRFKDGDVRIVYYRNRGGDTGNSFKSMSFSVRIGSVVYPINFKKCLVQCAQGIMYSNVDVVPHSPLESIPQDGIFNLFGQYQHQYNPKFVIDQKKVDLWLNHIREVLAAGDPVVGEYLVNWFAHLLQFPNKKTEAVPLIKGRAGCGKNLTFNVFMRYVLNPSLSIMCPDMEKLFSRFNSARLGKLLVVLDEAVDSYDRKMNNRMKNFITEERVQIENKGKDIVEVSDFSNYAIITNNDFASIIEKNDRRYLCLEASECRVGDRDYFNNMVKQLLNVEAGCHIFHWLLKRDLSSFVSRDLPSTKYKRELAARQTDSVVKWLLYKYEKLSEAEDCETTELCSKDWYDRYAHWCREIGGESKVHSLSVFNSRMNEEAFTTTVRKEKQHDGSRKNVKVRAISISLIRERLGQYICN